MTFRNRTVAKRGRRRSSWQQDTRRNLVLNIAFVLAIVAALAILGGVLFAGWYGDHWASVMTINGRSYSLDDVNARVGVIKAIDSVENQTYVDLRNSQKISESDYSAFQQAQQSQSPAGQRAVTDLHDEAVIASYAQSKGITVSDQDVQAQVDKAATVAELRHIKIIAVRAVGTDPSQTPTASDVSAAQNQAQSLLNQIKGGAKWDDVAKQTDTSFFTAPSGDLGTATHDTFEQATALNGEPAILDAAFALPLNGYTDVIKGHDGIFRFATVTSIVPPQKDPNWESKLQKAGASLDAYHAQARAAALQSKVKAQIVQQYAFGPTKQRHVQEIYFNSRYNSTGADEVRARFATFAPNKDPSAASGVKADDPAWTDAKKRADDFYNQVKADPSKFVDLTRSQSDDKTWAPAGGELPYLNETTFQQLAFSTKDASGNTTYASDSLFKTNPKPTTDQVFEPVKTDQGYVVFQFVDTRPGPTYRIAAARLMLNGGADFGTIAQQMSDAPTAADQGDLGWVSEYEDQSVEQNAIFNAKIGSVTDPVALVDSQGNTQATVIYKVLEERTATPSAADSERLKTLVFDNWFTAQSANASASADQTRLGPIVNPSATP